MPPAMVVMVAVASNAVDRPPVGRLDEVVDNWHASQRGLRSLVVEFTCTGRTGPRRVQNKWHGTFRLARDESGVVFAAMELTEEKAAAKGDVQPDRYSFLLYGRSFYILNETQKEALQTNLSPERLNRLAECFMGPTGLLLLDRADAEKKNNIKLIKEDQWYSYLTVVPKTPPTGPSLWAFLRLRNGETVFDHFFQNRSEESQAVFLNQPGRSLPKGAPIRLWDRCDCDERQFDITSWQRDTVDGPRPSDFVRPEDRPGWRTVYDVMRPVQLLK